MFSTSSADICFSALYFLKGAEMLFWAIHALPEASALVNSKHMVGPGIMTIITGVLFVGKMEFLLYDSAGW